MKQKSLSTKLIFVFLFLAVVIYFGAQGYRYFANPQTTTLVYAYETEQTLVAKGFFVRDEQVIDCTDERIELSRGEGERVAAGGVLATVYADSEALAGHRELVSLRERLEQLRYAESAAQDAETALKLDGEIRKEIKALNAAMAAESFSAADDAAAELKTAVLRREYAYRGAEELAGHISELKAEIKALEQRLSGGVREIKAPTAGTYSAHADGYEAVLTPALLKDINPQTLENLAPEGVNSTVGKLIRGGKWRFAAIVSEAQAKTFAPGQRLWLRVPGGADFDLPITVERVGKAEDGRAVVTLLGESYIHYVTMLREESVELITTRYEGLRVPKNALRVDAEGKTGVFCRVGLNAYRKPVEIVYQGEDYCLVKPGTIDAKLESAVLLYTLRAGDEVIVSADDLYDGKVVG